MTFRREIIVATSSFSPNIIRVSGWAGLVACMRTTKMRAEVWWGGLEDRILGRPKRRWNYNIKM